MEFGSASPAWSANSRAWSAAVSLALPEKDWPPGMMASHYAPDAAMRLAVRDVKPGEALLSFGPHRVAGSDRAAVVLNLSETGDLREAAANLFDFMRRLDATGAATIAVEPIPFEGLGEAINDRLKRAAAPR